MKKYVLPALFETLLDVVKITLVLVGVSYSFAALGLRVVFLQ